MPKVGLKDAGGELTYYNDIDTVSLNTEDGGMATYISQHLI